MGALIGPADVSRALTSAQREALSLVAAHLPSGAYLAGGVAVAQALQHRQSVDLDFFVPHEFAVEQLQEELAVSVSSARITSASRATLYLEVEGVPVSVIWYRYPLLDPPVVDPVLRVPIATLNDLVAMKLLAIGNRGAAKDFWDLDAMLTHGAANDSMQDALALFERKFVSSDTAHIVRSLAYFDEADVAPLPAGMSPSEWTALKARMRARVRDLT